MSEKISGQEKYLNPEHAKTAERRMPADHVVEVYDLLEGHGIKIWVDGGWGVDALLGEQTREHGDLDLAIQERDLPRMRELLAMGLSEQRRGACSSLELYYERPEWT